MANGLIKEDDDSRTDNERTAGRIGRGFGDIDNENTASLGLKKPIAKLSQSLGFMLNEEKTRDNAHEQIAFQFLTAKVYENREYIAKAGVSASANQVITAKRLVSSSVQIASDISGSFVEMSGSLSTRLVDDKKLIDEMYGKGLINSIGEKVAISQNGAGALVFTIKGQTFTVSADR
jgi:hypothetical protein